MGFEGCDAPLTQALLGYRATGGDTAVVDLGAKKDGPFMTNRAFASRHAVGFSRELLEAIASVYQSFLGSATPNRRRRRTSGGDD